MDKENMTIGEYILELEKENAELKRQLEERQIGMESITFSLKEFGGDKSKYVFSPNDSTGTFWSLTKKA